MAIDDIFTARRGARPLWHDAAVGLALVAVLWPAIAVIQRAAQVHWLLTSGLVFALLWRLPARWWPWLVLAVACARSSSSYLNHPEQGWSSFFDQLDDPIRYALGNATEAMWLASGVCLLRWWRIAPSRIDSIGAMARLHVAALLTAVVTTGKDWIYVLYTGSETELPPFLLRVLLGHFVGVMLFAPVIAWATTPAFRAGSAPLLRAAVAQLLPTMALLVALGAVSPYAQVVELLRLLLLATVVVFAMRHGWRGAALSVMAASFAVAIEERLGASTTAPVLLQMFIAIAGAMALLFGTTVDGLRDEQRRLSDANRRAVALAGDLRLAALRNLQTEERERRRLAAELHDEFGQTLTALQTHLKLAQPAFVAADRLPALDTLLELTRAMRSDISGVLESLRPAVLDELGLFAAIDRGSVRHRAEDAGLAFDTDLLGDARLLHALDPATQTAAYRIVQEAVTNVVRHARAGACSVTLRANRRSGLIWLFIDIRDDGTGGAAHLQPGNGLTGMRDRVVALGGRLHLADTVPGLRVHALLRQAAG